MDWMTLRSRSKNGLIRLGGNQATVTAYLIGHLARSLEEEEEEDEGKDAVYYIRISKETPQ